MTPEIAARIQGAMNVLDAMADTWAAEVGLAVMAAALAQRPDGDHRADGIDAFARNAFTEGAYRLFLAARAEGILMLPYRGSTLGETIRAATVQGADSGMLLNVMQAALDDLDDADDAGARAILAACLRKWRPS